METRKESVRPSRKVRLAIGIALAAIVIGLVIYFGRGKDFPRTDPNIGKDTGVIIEGTVACNGQLLASGYVVAWQGPPIASGAVQADGSYRIYSAPLGKCLLTYSAIPPHMALSMHKMEEDDGPFPKDTGPPKDKDFPPKDKMPAKDKGFPPKDKMPPKDKDFPPKDKTGFPPKEKKEFFGSKENSPAPLSSEQKRLAESASAKYHDPTVNAFEIVTKKGTNSKHLSLEIP